MHRGVHSRPQAERHRRVGHGGSGRVVMVPAMAPEAAFRIGLAAGSEIRGAARRSFLAQKIVFKGVTSESAIISRLWAALNLAMKQLQMFT